MRFIALQTVFISALFGPIAFFRDQTRCIFLAYPLFIIFDCSLSFQCPTILSLVYTHIFFTSRPGPSHPVPIFVQSFSDPHIFLPPPPSPRSFKIAPHTPHGVVSGARLCLARSGEGRAANNRRGRRGGGPAMKAGERGHPNRSICRESTGTLPCFIFVMGP
jgi:hypothetical protein